MDCKSEKNCNKKKLETKIATQTGKDPMICTVCENYYEYKGDSLAMTATAATNITSKSSSKIYTY